MAQPAAISARKTLDWAVRVGRARRWSCFACGRPVPVSKPHFDDPERRPLAVRWYCDPCWRLDKRERQRAIEEAKLRALKDLETRSRMDRDRRVLADLDASPALKAELSRRIRSRLPEKIVDLGVDTPLFRQLLAREHLHS